MLGHPSGRERVQLWLSNLPPVIVVIIIIILVIIDIDIVITNMKTLMILPMISYWPWHAVEHIKGGDKTEGNDGDDEQEVDNDYGDLEDVEAKTILLDLY